VASVDCDAETVQGTGRGLGSMTMGVAWAWPDPSLDDSVKLEVVLELMGRLVDLFNDSGLSGHPLDICHELVAQRSAIADQIYMERGLGETIPELAVLLASSPIEAALFDAHGKAEGQSSYALLGRDHLVGDLSRFLGEKYEGVFLDQLIARAPVESMPLYHLVGALDPLSDSDVDDPIGDGLPETLKEWIDRNQLSHLKIKLAGDDLGWDVERVSRVHAIASECRGDGFSFSLDFNERCRDEDYVLRMLEDLGRDSPDSLSCIGYIEQPTHRDLERKPVVTMHRVKERMPVVIDESLVDLRSLRTAVSQGYSGIALKACKGHSEALLLGAVARHENLYLCVQDLTCVGASLLHSASLAAHIPGVAAIESNGRQYCPQGNSRWMQRFGDFFEVRGGRVPTSQLAGPGLGYGNDPTLD
ncbi:MAG: mandelate racemase/muconate lactonizing enzyme family protein, partial [Planctomycetota bacterium]